MNLVKFNENQEKIKNLFVKILDLNHDFIIKDVLDTQEDIIFNLTDILNTNEYDFIKKQYKIREEIFKDVLPYILFYIMLKQT